MLVQRPTSILSSSHESFIIYCYVVHLISFKYYLTNLFEYSYNFNEHNFLVIYHFITLSTVSTDFICNKLIININA